MPCDRAGAWKMTSTSIGAGHFCSGRGMGSDSLGDSGAPGGCGGGVWGRLGTVSGVGCAAPNTCIGLGCLRSVSGCCGCASLAWTLATCGGLLGMPCDRAGAWKVPSTSIGLSGNSGPDSHLRCAGLCTKISTGASQQGRTGRLRGRGGIKKGPSANRTRLTSAPVFGGDGSLPST